MYFLDKGADQVLRFRVGANGFTGKENWLKQDLDLAKASDLAIDGNIYFAFEDGRVEKFLSGSKTEFSLATIDPPLANIRKIAVSKEKDFLYVLDPSNKRLVVFNKKGGFVSQYYAESLSDLKAFYVEEGTKKIYALNSASLYVFDAVHIK